MIACICRVIYEDSFDSKEELKARIMEDDFHCGQCQLKYLEQDFRKGEYVPNTGGRQERNS